MKTKTEHTPKAEASHTPGPLTFDGYGINGGDEFKSRVATFPNFGMDAERYGPLFAAAPELLEALQGIFRECAIIHKHWGSASNQKEADAVVALAEAAIRKATGGK